MPSLLSRHDAASRSALAVPLVALASYVFATISSSNKHALFASAVAWLAICIYTTSKVGARSLLDAAPSQRLAWAAGGLLEISAICERAVDGRGLWWAKALPPILLYTFARSGVIDEASSQPDSPGSPAKPGATTPTIHGSKSSLAILTLAGIVTVYAHSGSISIVALGLSNAILQVLAFHLIERARGAAHRLQNGDSIIYSANGLLTQPVKPLGSSAAQWTSLLRDVSTAGALTAGVAAVSLESRRFGGLGYYGFWGQIMGQHWVLGQGALSVLLGTVTLLVHIVLFGALVLMVHRQGAFLTSFVPLAAVVCSQLLVGFSLSRLWFAVLCAAAITTFFDEQDAISNGSRMKLRLSKILTLVAALSFAISTIFYLHQNLKATALPTSAPFDTDGFYASSPLSPLAPLQYANKKTHPIESLVRDAQATWGSKLQQQSQSLEAAVMEYKRRYGMPPPPHFDKWYAFATSKGVQLIDDYDTIYHSLLPFWGLSPATIRARAREAMGFADNFLMGLLIRNGKAVHVEVNHSPEWLQQATVGMMEQFVEYLPDMDLLFNVHDESRVVVPHDDLSRLIKIALDTNIPAASAESMPRNAFSERPQDLSSGKRVEEVKTTRFNMFAHQPTWVPSRLSCSPDSAARALEESMAQDNLTAYAMSELAFVYNQTAFSDVCNNPSFAHTHGFFQRPNAFNLVHDLFPVFSQSKMSSFQDILFPSPWYWYGKVAYKESQDPEWSKKESRLWWRGSTTGGFSREGGWKRQHRQTLVRKLNALDQAKVFSKSNAAAKDINDGTEWIVKEVSRQDFKELIDVHFSHVYQCDPGDCDAIREFFQIAEMADQQDAWKYKYLLDMDGNAFSGRFYAFMRSRSLPFKMAVFREWHEEWIKPWVHYIPLSLRAEEALEAVRFFDAEDEGKDLAVKIAESGTQWATKALRNEDFEAWWFRLLLEYGRVIDDNRASIGYSGA